jgi:hypothetical protein
MIGIPIGRVFFPDVKRYHLNSAYGLPNQGFSMDFASRKVCFRMFGSGKFPNTFKEKRDSQMQTQEKIIAVQARELKVLYLLPISNISNTI